MNCTPFVRNRNIPIRNLTKGGIFLSNFTFDIGILFDNLLHLWYDEENDNFISK